jgi:iron complex transport system permease protein
VAVAASPPGTPGARPKRRRLRLAGILGAGALLVLLSPLVDPVPIPAIDVAQILGHQLTGGLLFPSPCTAGVSAQQCTAWTEIVWESALPSIVLALLAGAALGLSGATLQGTFRNPLADPYLLGLSSGGTLGAAFLFVFNVGIAEANVALPLFAFMGALATGGVILLAARRLGGSVETLLLVGVALANLLSAVLSVVLLFNPEGSLQVSFWLLGGVGGATWNRDGIVLGGLLIASAPLVLLGRELNLLQLGGDVAQSLGVDARRVRTRLLLFASLATAMAVAFTGIIGFVGLISPHVVRRVWGPDYRAVLPGSILAGAAFLLLAHDLSELAVPSVVLPVGLFTAFAGAPFFFYLLYRHRRGSYMGGSL